MSIIRTASPILVELIDLVNSVITFLLQTTLLSWLTVLLGSQTVILKVLLFWIYFFLLVLVFLLQWLSLRWEILMILLSPSPLTFHKIQNRMPVSSHSFWLFLCWLGQSPWSFAKCSMGSGWNWYIYLIYIPIYVSLNCLHCCHCSYKSLFSFVLTK